MERRSDSRTEEMFDSIEAVTPGRRARFLVGEVIVSPAAARAISQPGNKEFASTLVDCHQCGVWEEVPPEVVKANDRACDEGDDIISVYSLRSGERVWVVTDGQRQWTALLLDSDDC
jgi:hypothetical protein